MKITLEIADETLALHIVAVTRGDWPNIKLWNLSVPSAQIKEGAVISTVVDDQIPLRCRGCSFYVEHSNFCSMHNEEVTGDDYCSHGAWTEKEG